MRHQLKQFHYFIHPLKIHPLEIDLKLVIGYANDVK